MVVTILPRPHKETGARFVIDGIAVVPMNVFTDLLETLTGAHGDFLEQHKIERRRKVEETNGDADFALMTIIALNEGQHKVADGPASAMRIKPLAVNRWLYEQMNREHPNIDWEGTLRMQVRDDLPARTV